MGIPLPPRLFSRALTTAVALAIGGAIPALTLPTAAVAAERARPAPLAAALRAALRSDRTLSAFYRQRSYRPIWVETGGVRPEAARILSLIGDADKDGLDPQAYGHDRLIDAVADAQTGNPQAIARAEVLLSQALTEYVADLRRAPNGMIYVDRQLTPEAPSPAELLADAVAASSLERFLEQATRMSPVYERLRDAFAERRDALSPSEAQLFRANLDRARALPADLGRRYVLVDAASARLWMVEDGRTVGSMRVVVGRPGEPTPMMAGLIRFTTLNPYWNVPPDLVQRQIAPKVIEQGVGYLRTAGYEVVSDWSDNARPVDPSSVDWQAVLSGRRELPVRQLPGPANSMGRMKFMFPNELGVYLHDTPNRALFRQQDRRQSAGCVRLEDADRLARWLYGRRVRPQSDRPEQHVALPEPVPVYITYLTVSAEGERIAYHPDVYGRDGRQLAQAGGEIRGTR